MLREQTMTEQHGWLGDHKVRRIGYGAMQLAEGTPPPRDDAIAVLRRAVELGVDHIDTAEFYGDGLANDLIRAALWPYPDDLALVSKVGAVREGRRSSRRSGPSSSARVSRPTCAGSASSVSPP